MRSRRTAKSVSPGQAIIQPQAAQASGDGFAGLRFEIAFQVAFVQPDSAGDFGDGVFKLDVQRQLGNIDADGIFLVC